jgi:hypothetical protein
MNCLSDPSASAIPGGFDNLIVPTTRVLDDSEPDYRLLRAIAAKYAPGTPTTDEGQASFGFVTVMGLGRATKNLKAADATPSGIAAAFRSMTPEPQPLLSSRTFQCNRTAYSLLPAVCSNSGALQTVDTSGRVTNTEPFDATPYL